MDKRVFVITGATGATGRAAARAFAQRGASLALVSTDPAKLDAMARELSISPDRIMTQPVELRDGKAVHACAEAIAGRFGRVDALIHLVGGWTGGKTIPEADPADFESMLGQHAWTTFHLLRAFTPHLVANGWGRAMIVSATNIANPPGKAAAYAAAKAAQENLMLNLASELKGTGVTANIIQVRAIDVNNEGKGTTPDEIAAAMLYLCSDEAGKINGARIPLG
jgi:NAD(P)-dependent dehydrogenase (short-subunit alcohol dehydrogenase family)